MYKVVINTKFRIVATSEKAGQERNQEGLYGGFDFICNNSFLSKRI